LTDIAKHQYSLKRHGLYKIARSGISNSKVSLHLEHLVGNPKMGMRDRVGCENLHVLSVPLLIRRKKGTLYSATDLWFWHVYNQIQLCCHIILPYTSYSDDRNNRQGGCKRLASNLLWIISLLLASTSQKYVVLKGF